MGCVKNPSRTLPSGLLERSANRRSLANFLALFLVAFPIFWLEEAHARFASRFSIAVGEEYNDNIFFTRKKTHDFITTITPTLTILYAPESVTVPTLTLNISPSGQIFARQSELNNFGESVSLNGGYAYQYSPTLTFNLSDTFQRTGRARTAGTGGQADPLSQSSVPTGGGAQPVPDYLRSGDLISRGDTLRNFFSVGGRYLYTSNVSFTGNYGSGYTKFLGADGSETYNSLGVRGVYKWGEQHNLHAGYSVSIIKTRDGETNVIHNFDLGDDYFSTYQIQLTPTLTLSASTGASLNTGPSGPRVANNSNVTVTKLWETASLSAGLRSGLTPSFGVAGISNTTTLFANFRISLSEYLTGTAGVDSSFFDTNRVNFGTFQASAGLQYWIASWLSSNLRYSHRWRDAGAGARTTDLGTSARVHANSVSLVFSVYFDIWPNVGLSRGLTLPPWPSSAPPSAAPIYQPPKP